jgi:transposase-like protein
MPKRITYSKEQWSTEEKQRVVQLLSEKKSVQDISTQLNRSPNAVIKRFTMHAEEQSWSLEQSSSFSGIPVETLQSYYTQKVKPQKIDTQKVVTQPVQIKKDRSKYNHKEEQLQLLREIRDYMKIIATSHR